MEARPGVAETSSALDAFLAQLPKVELHLHLEGSLQPETLRELARAKGGDSAGLVSRIGEPSQQGFRYGGFQAFLEAYKRVSLLLETPADYALAATRLVEGLARENVKYAEVTLSAGVILWKKQSIEAVFEAVRGAARAAEERLGVRVNWVFDAIRHFGADPAREVVRWAARLRGEGVVAFGIGGDEARGPAELFTRVFHEARAEGLRVTAHAGETAGPESVRRAVELLGAERIGHALSAARDPEVLALLRERRVPVEVCLTSNLATGALARPKDHPLPQFLESGVIVTLNTDDPGLFGTSLNNEFRLAAKHFSLGRDELVGFCENAIRASFLPEAERTRLLADLRKAAPRGFEQS